MTETTNATTTTRTIAGHAFTLTVGRRYLASRPMAQRGMAKFDVRITDTTDGSIFGNPPVAIVRALSYDRANELLVAFNGEESFAGRVWE